MRPAGTVASASAPVASTAGRRVASSSSSSSARASGRRSAGGGRRRGDDLFSSSSSSSSSSSARASRVVVASSSSSRGGEDDAWDMTRLSDFEREAMRAEWSLECRQVGLDHLADCFQKPSVANPADVADQTAEVAALKAALSDASIDPIEHVTSSIAPTDDEPAKLAFLNGEGVEEIAHTGNGTFDAHLLGVKRVLGASTCHPATSPVPSFHEPPITRVHVSSIL
jgi:hypothetical protein